MLIAISGRKHAGKSTLASFLVDTYGFQRHPFMKTMKDMLGVMGLSHAQLYGNEKDIPCKLLGGKTPRYAFESLGYSWGRGKMDEDLWIRVWKATKPDGNVVVDDLRLPNELELMRSMGGVVFNVVRPGLGSAGTHPTEADSLPYDYQIQNNGLLADLFDPMNSFMLDRGFVCSSSD